MAVLLGLGGACGSVARYRVGPPFPGGKRILFRSEPF